VILSVFGAERTREVHPMACDKSVLSELADALKSGEVIDVVRRTGTLRGTVV
jgi:hypothetical protein